MNVKTGTVKIESQNIVLRRFRLFDFFSVIKWFCDPRIASFSISRKPPTKWEVFKIIVGKLRRYHNMDFYSWTIVVDGKSNGLIELIPVKNRDNIYSISYKLNMNLNSRGITTEALKMVIEYLKTQDIEYIISVCDVDNIASKRVMEKAGMTEYGNPDTNPPLHYADNTFGKTYRYRYMLNNDKGEFI